MATKPVASARLNGRDYLMVSVPGENRVLGFDAAGNLRVELEHPSANEEFGVSLTSIPGERGKPDPMDPDIILPDKNDTVIVGAPLANGGAGSVSVFLEVQPMMSPVSVAADFVIDGESGEVLGSSLDSGELVARPIWEIFDEVIIGAPGLNRARVLYSVSDLFDQELILTAADIGETTVLGDLFGSDVAIADMRGDGEFGYAIAGAPGSGDAGAPDAGALFFFRIETGAAFAHLVSGYRSDGRDTLPCFADIQNIVDFPVECDEPLDPALIAEGRLGTSVAANADIVVAGAPQSTASGKSSGRIYVCVRGRDTEPETVDPDVEQDQFFLMHWYGQADEGPSSPSSYDELP